jgi:Na+/H+ antiporter NhaC
MATAILHSIKQGAYIAISLYVVFIAVVTITSMNPQLKDRRYEAPATASAANQPVQERAS